MCFTSLFAIRMIGLTFLLIRFGSWVSQLDRLTDLDVHPALVETRGAFYTL